MDVAFYEIQLFLSGLNFNLSSKLFTSYGHFAKKKTLVIFKLIHYLNYGFSQGELIARWSSLIRWTLKVSSKQREAQGKTEQNALQTILTGSPCDVLWSCSIRSSSFLSKFILLFKKKTSRSQYQIIRSLLPKLKSGSNCSKYEWLYDRVGFQCESQD